MRCVKLYTVCTITHCVYNYMLCVQLHTEVLFAFKMEKLPSLLTSAADCACDFYEVRYPLLIFISIRNFFWNTLYLAWEERTGDNSSTSWFKCWQVYRLCPIWCSCCKIYTNINIICIMYITESALIHNHNETQIFIGAPSQFTSASRTTEEWGPGLVTINETLAVSTSDKMIPNFTTCW